MRVATRIRQTVDCRWSPPDCIDPRRRRSLFVRSLSAEKEHLIDHDRFDTLARSLANPASRRRLLRRLGLGALTAVVGGTLGRPRTARADHCDYIGCGCATGTFHPCGGGLVCCPSNPGLPGGAGVCAPADQCGGPCAASGDGCPSYCNWGDHCPGCCGGVCGNFGSCL